MQNGQRKNTLAKMTMNYHSAKHYIFYRAVVLKEAAALFNERSKDNEYSR